ncbi:esterase [Lithospermum erythrorhizon]|uniref:Pectinesterase n=1 Tax=Lithospermum erythrorhizon TaxID=34254 RepID=A0AAV3NK67_LITER
MEAGRFEDWGFGLVNLISDKGVVGAMTIIMRILDIIRIRIMDREIVLFSFIQGIKKINASIPVLLNVRESYDSRVKEGHIIVSEKVWVLVLVVLLNVVKVIAVAGEGFLARDMAFENTAGPEKHQAVALRINADLAAVYRCTISGYQDTLYIHSYRQFYRECNISGTIDYIFGNAAVVFQGCNIISRMPLPGQGTVITAQSRDSPDEPTGISIQNCSILATDELYSNLDTVNSYLGRPWRNYSTTVIMESFIDDFIDPEGWSEWSGDDGLDTLYYGEYENSGRGADTANRVTWAGYHVMDYDEASEFTVSEFITGEEWLDSTSFPYDDAV